jgi:hypothetical protein
VSTIYVLTILFFCIFLSYFSCENLLRLCIIYTMYLTRDELVLISSWVRSMVYMVCNINQYWVLSSRSANSWNNNDFAKLLIKNRGKTVFVYSCRWRIFLFCKWKIWYKTNSSLVRYMVYIIHNLSRFSQLK